jgi:hypothetical protein
MWKFKSIACATLIASFAGSVQAADVQGIVSQVVTLPVVNGKHVVRIYFSSYTHDRWLCLQNTGYVEANDASPNLDAKGLDRLVALALTAVSSGMVLGIDSPGINPCTDANMFHLIK